MFTRKAYYLLDENIQSLIPVSLDVTRDIGLSVPVIPRQLLLGPAALKVTDPNGKTNIEALFIVKNFQQGLSKSVSDQIPFVYAVDRKSAAFLQLTDLDFINNFSNLLFCENGEPSAQFDQIVSDLMNHSELYSVSTSWYRRVNSVNPSPFDLCMDQMAEFTHRTFAQQNENPQINWLMKYLPEEGRALLSASMNYSNLAKLSRALRNDAYMHLNKEKLALALRTTQPGIVYPWLLANTSPEQFENKHLLLTNFPALTIASIDPSYLVEPLPSFSLLDHMIEFLSEKLDINRDVVKKLAGYSDFDHKMPFSDVGKVQIINAIGTHKLPESPEQWEHLLLTIELLDSLAANFYRLEQFDTRKWVSSIFSPFMNTFDGGPPDYSDINAFLRSEINSVNGSILDLGYATTRLNTLAPNALLVPYVEKLVHSNFSKQLAYVAMINKAYRAIADLKATSHLKLLPPFDVFQHAHFLLIPAITKDGFNHKYMALNFSTYHLSQVCATLNMQGMVAWSFIETEDPQIDMLIDHLNTTYSVHKTHDKYFQQLRVLEHQSCEVQDNQAIQRPQWFENWMVTIGATNFDEAVESTAVVGQSFVNSAFRKIRYRLGL